MRNLIGMFVEGRGYEPYEARKLYVSTIGVKKYIVAFLCIWT